MVVDTITEAKAQLSSLIERVIHGEEVIIKRAGKPVAVLTAYLPHRVKRQAGALRGKIRISKDFDELPDDIAAAFGAEER